MSAEINIKDRIKRFIEDGGRRMPAGYGDYKLKEYLIEFGGYYKRERIIISDHDRFVIGWLHSDRSRDIFDFAVFDGDVDINVVILTNRSEINAEEVNFLESKGIQFADYFQKYRDLKKIWSLTGLGT